mmetsp:Transcript_115290/g.222244  ORF Transcript_115290/g.222244 Transcript_115290/m.222244 type:complete len:124 (-) Transcript_115290:145-516(-)
MLPCPLSFLAFFASLLLGKSSASCQVHLQAGDVVINGTKMHPREENGYVGLYDETQPMPLNKVYHLPEMWIVEVDGDPRLYSSSKLHDARLLAQFDGWSDYRGAPSSVQAVVNCTQETGLVLT